MDNIDEILAFLYECVCCVILGLILRHFDKINIFMLLLPILIMITLIIHEFIHIILFKLLNKKAIIKIINNNWKQIFIYQSNPKVCYSKLETAIILISPFIIITIITFFILGFINTKGSIYILFAINGVINAMGSVTDIVSIIKLYRTYFKQNIYINYDLNNDNVIMLINEKEN